MVRMVSKWVCPLDGVLLGKEEVKRRGKREKKNTTQKERERPCVRGITRRDFYQKRALR